MLAKKLVSQDYEMLIRKLNFKVKNKVKLWG